MDECRKAFEVLVIEKQHINQDHPDAFWAWVGFQAAWDHRAEAKVSGDWAEFREELSELIDGLQNDENWCNPQVMADCIMTKYPSIIQLPAPQSPNILTSLPPGKWIVTVKDEHNGSVEKFEEQSTVAPGVATSLSTDDISDFDIIRAFTSEATKRPIYDSVPKYTEEQVAIGLLSVRKYFESRQKTTPLLSGNPLPSRFELYEMFRGRSITDHAANSIAEDVRVIIAHLLALQSPVALAHANNDCQHWAWAQENPGSMGGSSIHAHLLANARESREDRYREALIEEYQAFLSRSYSEDQDSYVFAKEEERMGAMFFLAFGFHAGFTRALATVGKEG